MKQNLVKPLLVSLPYQEKVVLSQCLLATHFDQPTYVFEELVNSLSKAVNKCDNLIAMGDFNIDLNKTDCIGFGKLEEFCDNFNLTNIVKRNTCFTKNNKSTIDLLLTNKPMSFQMTNTAETGLSDCHKLISSFMKSYISRLKLKTIFYCDYKNFDE